MSDHRQDKKCMGEFPLFPGWLFFEQEDSRGVFRVTSYGPHGKVVAVESPNREFALAECLRKILQSTA